MAISADMIFWIQQKRWLLIAFTLGALLYFLIPGPAGLSTEGYHILIMMNY
ncbi:MAG: hypothetical protein U9Q77_10620 [Candidatus Marinimicrobia bacterium]|nr:hypothetical protein [Candidatus Neomarinimicrobiota bacterium]